MLCHIGGGSVPGWDALPRHHPEQVVTCVLGLVYSHLYSGPPRTHTQTNTLARTHAQTHTHTHTHARTHALTHTPHRHNTHGRTHTHEHACTRAHARAQWPGHVSVERAHGACARSGPPLHSPSHAPSVLAEPSRARHRRSIYLSHFQYHGGPARTGYRAAWDTACSHASLHRQPPTDEAPCSSTGGVSPSVRANVRSTYARSGSAATRA